MKDIHDDHQAGALLELEEVRELLAEGSEQGYVSADHVADALQDVELTPEQLDEILVAFHDLGIDVVEGEPAPRPTRNLPPRRRREEARPLHEGRPRERPCSPLPARDRQGAAAHGAAGGGARQAHRAQGHGGEGRAHRGQPSPRRLDREALRRSWHDPARPGTRGQPGAHQGGREVRLAPGLQVQHVRDLVDQAGHHARDRRQVAQHPPARAHGRDDHQAHPHPAAGHTGCG